MIHLRLADAEDIAVRVALGADEQRAVIAFGGRFGFGDEQTIRIDAVIRAILDDGKVHFAVKFARHSHADILTENDVDLRVVQLADQQTAIVLGILVEAGQEHAIAGIFTRRDAGQQGEARRSGGKQLCLRIEIRRLTIRFVAADELLRKRVDFRRVLHADAERLGRFGQVFRLPRKDFAFRQHAVIDFEVQHARGREAELLSAGGKLFAAEEKRAGIGIAGKLLILIEFFTI